jgi:hypothetical protein
MHAVGTHASTLAYMFVFKIGCDKCESCEKNRGVANAYARTRTRTPDHSRLKDMPRFL